MTDEQQLREKLRRIEALFSGATTAGERDAAAAALERIQARLAESERAEAPVEYTFTLKDHWNRRLFVALCRRYGLHPYRYKRQRFTTVNLKAPRSFIDGTLWPEYLEISQVLREYLDQVTERIIRDEVFKDTGEAREH